jgi:regulatory protein
MTQGKQSNPYYQAQALLSRRDHSLYELRGKLRKKGFSPEEITATLEKLKKENLVNDHRFAELFMESTLRRKAAGPRYLAAKLRQRGISDHIIQRVLSSYNNAEYEKKLAQQAAREWQRTHQRTKHDGIRLGRFLAARGFRHEVISSYLSKTATEYFPEDA